MYINVLYVHKIQNKYIYGYNELFKIKAKGELCIAHRKPSALLKSLLVNVLRTFA